MPSKILLVLPAVIAGVAGVPNADKGCKQAGELCVDGINDCGVPWGGCYDRCDPAASPTPPPCPSTYSEDPDDCSTRTVCWDGINDCGMMYGGCFSDCQPWPTFEPPPCPSSTFATVTTTPTAPAECEDGGEHFLCVDNINECGIMYGGCYDYCATPSPSFEVPPCPSGTGTGTGTEEPQPTGTDDGDWSIDDQCEREGSLIICVDGIDDCGNGWGECYDACTTTIESPTTPCSTTPGPTDPEPTETNCADITICVDYVNDCGMMYGGCHSVCSPTPSYTAPPCPSATESKRDGCPAKKPY